jgi:hypothetical protein
MHLILVEVGVDELAVLAVYDGGPVASSKDVVDAATGKGTQLDGLGAQLNLLLVWGAER